MNDKELLEAVLRALATSNDREGLMRDVLVRVTDAVILLNTTTAHLVAAVEHLERRMYLSQPLVSP